ncbi:hypothetical protein F0562_010660 [Nyssa sinensis]|uniref:DUF688 domain-containing protein n=1 Tax=Nyssa sinensis TaxID=561372 RepID=A0A5J5A4M2_9ASTE|nr:hypothetical protein F0562_010660 [Nyssa sinensis]
MEDKQLDFNQPLLSVRRFSSTATSGKDDKRKTDNYLPVMPTLPFYKSELKSGPVRNPGAVPFQWEQTPGRPKDERKQQTRAQAPIAPKLPPGRILKVKQQAPDKVSEDTSSTICQAGKVSSSSHSISSIDKNVTKIGCSKDAMVERENSDLEDGDEVYLDALDTLSRTESLFLNCSVSGLSGLENQDMKSSGIFSADPQTRDFMMGRFLPAAKAMASEASQYASWKQPVAREQPRWVENVVGGDKKPPLYRHRPNILPNYAKDNREEESSDEDDYDESGNVSAKVCGLLPLSCIKNSFCLLNPVPGMSVRTRALMSPAMRMHARSSSAGSCSGTENQRTGVAIYEQRSIGGPQTAEQHEDRSILKNDSNQITFLSNSQKVEGSSLYRRLEGGDLSPYQNGLPQSPFHEEKIFISIPEEAKNAGINGFSSHKKGPCSFRDLLVDQSTEWEIGSVSPMVEKTLYIDSVHKIESPTSNSCSSDMKGLYNSRENDLDIAKTRGMEEPPLVDSSLKDSENSNNVDEEVILQPKILKPDNSSLLYFPDKSGQELRMDILKGSGQDQVLHQECVTSANSKLPDNENLDFKGQQPPEVDNVENSPGSHSQFPLPPPLPKSPSESWLWHTLPSLSSRKPSSRSYLGTQTNPRNHAAKMVFVDPKWETIVKTTKGQHQPLRFSEELMSISET